MKNLNTFKFEIELLVAKVDPIWCIYTFEWLLLELIDNCDRLNIVSFDSGELKPAWPEQIQDTHEHDHISPAVHKLKNINRRKDAL